MGEKNLEDLLDRMRSDGEDQKFVILQSLVEKILNYLLTTLETTEMRIANLNMGIMNTTQYVAQQLNDMTGRLKELPGMENLKNIHVPPPESPEAQTTLSATFFQSLKQFIETKARELIIKKQAAPVVPEIKEEVPAEVLQEEEIPYTDDYGTFLEEKEKMLSDKEKYLMTLADQLASKEQQLQDRENTIEIIENSLANNLNLSEAIKMASSSTSNGSSAKGGEGEDEAFDSGLEELSKISDSIASGDDFNDEINGENPIDDLIDDDREEDDE